MPCLSNLVVHVLARESECLSLHVVFNDDCEGLTCDLRRLQCLTSASGGCCGRGDWRVLHFHLQLGEIVCLLVELQW